MNEIDFYNKVGKINGWDFSNLRVKGEGVKWDFYDEVTKRCKKSDILLDIGTGGGEKILSIAPLLLFLVGIDLSTSMIERARTNLNMAEVSNVRFSEMSSESLQFPTNFFDIVSSCHAPFCSTEISKVLKNGGLFLTQQVSEADKINLKTAFKRGQSLNEVDGTLKERYIEELRAAGFKEIQSFEYDANEYYKEPEDLIFLLKHTPIIPEFGETTNDLNILSKFIEENSTEKGIRTNSKRFMLIASK